MTAVDLTVGATLSNSGEITTAGYVGICGTASQYPLGGEPLCGHNVVSVSGNRIFSAVTGYGGSAVPQHSNVAGGTQASPTATPNNTVIYDAAARCFYNGTFGGSSFAFQVKTTEAAGDTYSGCMASLQLTPNGGSRQETVQWFGNGNMFLPVAGSRLIVGATSLSGMSNGSGIIHPLTMDAGQIVFAVGYDTGHVAAYFASVSGAGWNGANTAMYVGKDGTTGRSINAGGTVNAAGADYAEYERKAEGCGEIAKGQIIGFDRDGLITDKWKGAVSFGVKSTSPALVGGDTWKDRATVDRIAYCGKVPVNVFDAYPGCYITAIVADDGGIAAFIAHSPTNNTVGRVRRILADGRAEIVVMV